MTWTRRLTSRPLEIRFVAKILPLLIETHVCHIFPGPGNRLQERRLTRSIRPHHGQRSRQPLSGFFRYAVPTEDNVFGCQLERDSGEISKAAEVLECVAMDHGCAAFKRELG